MPDGSTLSFAPNGCYRVDRKLTITTATASRSRATARRSGRSPAVGSSAVRGSHAQHVHVLAGQQPHRTQHDRDRRQPLRGVNDAAYVPALEAQTAYVIGGVRNMVLDHVQAYDVYGDFVFVGAATQGLIVRELDLRPQRSPGLDDQRLGHPVREQHHQPHPAGDDRPRAELEGLDHPTRHDPQQHDRRRTAVLLRQRGSSRRRPRTSRSSGTGSSARR